MPFFIIALRHSAFKFACKLYVPFSTHKLSVFIGNPACLGTVVYQYGILETQEAQKAGG